jgi:hypothetical protein
LDLDRRLRVADSARRTSAAVTKDFGPLHADLNLDENVWRLEGYPRPQHWVALALSMTLPPPFGVMAEGYYFSNASPVATRDGGFLFARARGVRPSELSASALIARAMFGATSTCPSEGRCARPTSGV